MSAELCSTPATRSGRLASNSRSRLDLNAAASGFTQHDLDNEANTSTESSTHVIISCHKWADIAWLIQ